MSTETDDTNEQVIARHREALRYTLPENRRESLFAVLKPRPRIGILVPLAACLMLAVGLYLGKIFSEPAAGEALTAEIVSAHVRSLMVQHIADVVSTDQHTVKPWFDGKLDFSPQVKDFAAAGFPLTGGRLDYINSRPVAAVVYARRKHVINLFQWPVNGANTAPRLALRRGYHIYTWVSAGTEHWLISDVNAAELQQFVQLITGP